MQIPPIAPPPGYGNGIADINLPKQTTPTPATTGDTVQLSTYARAKQLKEDGASNSVIGAQLGLDAKTVETYFGTPAAAAATTPPQPFSPAQEAIQQSVVQAPAVTQTKK